MNTLGKFRAALINADPEQLIIAIEALAFSCAEGYLRAHPLPAEYTEQDRADVRLDMMCIAICDAMNAGAGLLMEAESAAANPPTEAQVADAESIAAAAIAKAAGKLN